MNGFIEFSIGGGNEGQSRFGRQTADAAHNENAVIVTKKQVPEFDTLRRAVESAMVAEQPPISSTPSVGDQVRELVELHDQGVLNDEQFEQGKAKILG